MSGLDRLDEWITGGRFRSEPLVVTCKGCEEQSQVVAETEYGATVWLPEECPVCGEPWDGSEDWVLDEPPEPYRDDWPEDEIE